MPLVQPLSLTSGLQGTGLWEDVKPENPLMLCVSWLLTPTASMFLKTVGQVGDFFLVYTQEN